MELGYPSARQGKPRNRFGSVAARAGKANRERLEGEIAMAVCDVCGNDYDKTFEIRAQGATHTFDSFECAIQALAPICAHCGCRVIGHGVESDGRIFCCAHCASLEGVAELKDRA
jgi:Rieske Fe-S protein